MTEYTYRDDLTIDDIPDEILLCIAKHIKRKDLINFFCSNAKMGRLSHTDFLWKEKVLVLHPSIEIESEGLRRVGATTWKEVYQIFSAKFEWEDKPLVTNSDFSAPLIFNQNKSVTLQHNPHPNSRVILGTTPLNPKLRYYWEVLMSWTAYEDECDRFVGIATQEASRQDFLGDNSSSWAYASVYRSGTKWHRRFVTPYDQQKGFKRKDRVGVLLENGNLSFFVNGVPKGIAFRDIYEPVYPAVYLSVEGDTATFL